MRAVFAAFDPGTDALQLGFEGGAIYLQVARRLLPVDSIPGGLGPVKLVDDGSAVGLSGDERLMVDDLMYVLFGPAVLRVLARRGGGKATPAQIAAARKNGKKGGRPRLNARKRRL